LSIQGALKGHLAKVDAQGPLAVAHLALDGDGTLLAMTTRRALDRLGLKVGQPIFALVKTAALDERLVGGA
jgi:molybdate transport system ATP-binding protein